MFTALIVAGAKSKQLGAFVWSEGLTVLCIGLITGLLSGVALAGLLVLMLTHIFDPPPDVLQVPWFYLILLLLAMILSTVIAVYHAIHTAKQAGVTELRAL
jgi:putative ABC transport system permease protein